MNARARIAKWNGRVEVLDQLVDLVACEGCEHPAGPVPVVDLIEPGCLGSACQNLREVDLSLVVAVERLDRQLREFEELDTFSLFSAFVDGELMRFADNPAGGDQLAITMLRHQIDSYHRDVTTRRELVSEVLNCSQSEIPSGPCDTYVQVPHFSRLHFLLSVEYNCTDTTWVVMPAAAAEMLVAIYGSGSVPRAAAMDDSPEVQEAARVLVGDGRALEEAFSLARML